MKPETIKEMNLKLCNTMQLTKNKIIVIINLIFILNEKCNKTTNRTTKLQTIKLF